MAFTGTLLILVSATFAFSVAKPIKLLDTVDGIVPLGLGHTVEGLLSPLVQLKIARAASAGNIARNMAPSPVWAPSSVNANSQTSGGVNLPSVGDATQGLPLGAVKGLTQEGLPLGAVKGLTQGLPLGAVKGLTHGLPLGAVKGLTHGGLPLGNVQGLTNNLPVVGGLAKGLPLGLVGGVVKTVVDVPVSLLDTLLGGDLLGGGNEQDQVSVQTSQGTVTASEQANVQMPPVPNVQVPPVPNVQVPPVPNPTDIANPPQIPAANANADAQAQAQVAPPPADA